MNNAWMSAVSETFDVMRRVWSMRGDFLAFGIGIMVCGQFDDFTVMRPTNDNGGAGMC